MLKRLPFYPFGLTFQIVISFILIIVLATAAVAIPATWLIRNQLERDAWKMVGQGAQITEALYAGKLKDLENLALLTAQRPTLHRLVEEDQPAELQEYLAVFRRGADLGFVAVCSSGGETRAQTGLSPGSDACSFDERSGYWIDLAETGSTVWMASSQPLTTDQDDDAKIIVGTEVGLAILKDFLGKTGLQQMIMVDNESGATSFQDSTLDLDPVELASQPGKEEEGFLLRIGGQPFFAKKVPLDGNRLEAIVALPGNNLVGVQRQLTNSIGGSLLLVIGLGSLAGIFIARRVSRPLAELYKAAIKFRKGDLDSSVNIPSYIPEVKTVAYALEDARVNLRYSINELRYEKAWTDHLLGSIVEGIITLDRQGRITFFSQGAERLTGWMVLETLGQPVDEIIQVLDDGGVFSQLIPGPGRKKRIRLLRKDGREIIVAVTGAEMAPPEAGKAQVVLVLRDVSDEEAIHQFLGGFLANITHEFRTPLSSLEASIELLMDQLPDLSPNELGELLLSLHLGVLNLQTLIDNLLEGSSIEAGRFRVSPRPTQFKAVLEEVTNMMKPLFEKYGQQLRVSTPEEIPLVNVDARRTGQVLVNLLSNAVKFSSSGGETEVGVDIEEDCIRVRVTDEGAGIPGQANGVLFQRFKPGSKGDSSPPYGVGLGLSVVKAIVEAQGGTVGAFNRPEGGATFWFNLPRVEQGLQEESEN